MCPEKVSDIVGAYFHTLHRLQAPMMHHVSRESSRHGGGLFTMCTYKVDKENNMYLLHVISL